MFHRKRLFFMSDMSLCFYEFRGEKTQRARAEVLGQAAAGASTAVSSGASGPQQDSGAICQAVFHVEAVVTLAVAGSGMLAVRAQRLSLRLSNHALLCRLAVCVQPPPPQTPFNYIPAIVPPALPSSNPRSIVKI
jgi:hypothetical protein